MHMAHHIPIDLIILILVKLPVKSLLRFKSVCKLWKSIINDSSFIERHLIFHQLEDDPQIVTVFNVTSTSTLVSSLDIQAKTNNTITIDGDPGAVNNNIMKVDVAELRSWNMLPYSCNGIICFHRKNDIHLCNPSTREFRTLPQGSLDSSLYYGDTIVGFGRDEITKKYKAVRFCSGIAFFDGVPYSRKEYEVLTLDAEDGSSSWRNMGSLPSLFFRMWPYGAAVLVGSTLHFLMYAYSLNTEEEDTIVAFDLHTEKFRQLSFPPYPMNRGIYCYDISLLNLGGFLCLTVMWGQTPQHPNMDFLIMKNSTVGGTVWEKLYEIDLGLMDGYTLDAPHLLFPVAGHNNTTVSFCLGGHIFYNYDPRSGRVVRRVSTVPTPFKPIGYVQSLVPIFETRADALSVGCLLCQPHLNLLNMCKVWFPFVQSLVPIFEGYVFLVRLLILFFLFLFSGVSQIKDM